MENVRYHVGGKRSFILLICALIGTGFVGISLIGYFHTRFALRRSIERNELPVTSENISTAIQKDLVRPVLISSMMASDTFLRDWCLSGELDPQRAVKFLAEIQERYGTLTSFFVSEKTRRYYQAEGMLKTVRTDEPRDAWFFRVRSMNDPYEINIDPDLANADALTIFINYRVLDYSEKFLGAVGVGLSVDTLSRLVDSYQEKFARSVYFVDPQGRINLSGKGGPKQGSHLRDIGGLASISLNSLNSGEGSYRYRREGSVRLLNVRFLPELGWYLFVERDEASAMAGLNTTLFLELFISALITLLVILLASFTINRYQSRLEDLAAKDRLTGLGNRQAFDILGVQAIKEAERSGNPLSLVLFDIDHFKEINDGFGHFAGDAVLRSLAEVCRAQIRACDMFCRWGGDEFLVLLKDADKATAATKAEDLRRAVLGKEFFDQERVIRVTVSAGAAEFIPGESLERLVARADEALYRAKASGRNTSALA